MGLFGKKNRNDAIPETNSNQPAQVQATNDLSSLLHESVPETALDFFRANSVFTVERDGEQMYVGLMLAASDIGGLSKKDRHDEVKGSIIEQINSGRIRTFAPLQMLKDGKFVIIPDAETLDVIMEYSLLSNAPYKIAYIDNNANVYPTNVSVSYAQTVNVAEGTSDISTILGEHTIDESSDDAELELIEDESDDIPLEDEDVDDDEDNIDDDVPDDFSDDEPEYDDITDEPVDDFAGEDDIEDTDDTDDEIIEDEDDSVDDDYDEYEEEEEPEPDITENDVEKTLNRRFHSEELGLEITTAPFDLHFGEATDALALFKTDRPSGWLNDYLNELSSEANETLVQLHNKNLFILRSMYLNLVNKGCMSIEQTLDTERADGKYGKILSAIRQAKVAELESLDMHVSAKKTELDTAWQKKLADVGEQAASAARRQYEDRYYEQHQMEMFNVEPDMRESIEAEALRAKAEMLDNRKQDAAKRLDMIESETLIEITKKYAEMLDDEKKVHDEYHKRIMDYLDDNRKEDIAHTNALAEELAQKTKADKVKDEYTVKINAMTAEFEAKRQQSADELARIQRNCDEELAERQARCDSIVNDLNKQIEQLKEERRELLENYKAMDGRIHDEYASRINQMENDKAAVSEELKHVTEVHKRTSRIAIFAVIVIAIACAAIGIIFGYSAGSTMANDVTKEYSQTVIETQATSVEPTTVESVTPDKSIDKIVKDVQPTTKALK